MPGGDRLSSAKRSNYRVNEGKCKLGKVNLIWGVENREKGGIKFASLEVKQANVGKFEQRKNDGSGSDCQRRSGGGKSAGGGGNAGEKEIRGDGGGEDGFDFKTVDQVDVGKGFTGRN